MYRLNLISIVFCILIFNISCSTHKIDIENKNCLQNVKRNQLQDSLAFELCQIYGLDQGIRNEFLWRKHVNFGNVHNAIDTLNFNRVIKFIKKNGFPTKILLGENNLKNECVDGAVIAVLLHNPHRIVNETVFFDLFNNEIKKGNLKSERLADILDKYYWIKSKNKKERRVFYGSQFGKPCIQTKEATNLARIEIGLRVLKDEEFVDCGTEILDMPKIRK